MPPVVAEVKPQNDGSVLLHLQVADTPEVAGWILRWGEFCEVIEPATLRAAVRKRLEAVLGLYRNG